MGNYKQFNSLEFGLIRTVMVNNEPYFVGKDIACALGYSNPSKALTDHVDPEDKLNNDSLSSLGQRGGWLINESGMYSLIMGSKLDKAKKFKKWVTGEVLPSIRKNGMYATDELINNPDLLIQVATQLKEERQARQELEHINQANQPKVLFADSVASSRQTILIGDLAKLIKQNGYDIGQNRLFEVKERTHLNPDGSVRLTKTTKVTGKGQVYFINKFLQN